MSWTKIPIWDRHVSSFRLALVNKTKAIWCYDGSAYKKFRSEGNCPSNNSHCLCQLWVRLRVQPHSARSNKLLWSLTTVLTPIQLAFSNTAVAAVRENLLGVRRIRPNTCPLERGPTAAFDFVLDLHSRAVWHGLYGGDLHAMPASFYYNGCAYVFTTAGHFCGARVLNKIFHE